MANLSNNLQRFEIAIVGAGLSGMYLAHRLVEQWGAEWADQHLRVFDSRRRCGGRILGVKEAGQGEYGFDLGPTWLWPEEQPAMSALVAKLQLPLLGQWQQGSALYLPNRLQPPQRYPDQYTYAGACRIAGGSQQLIEALRNSLPESVIRTGHHLRRMQDEGSHIGLEFLRQPTNGTTTLSARQVVLAVPPRIAANSIHFNPGLPGALRTLMESTPTWMAGHAKVLVQYAQPFWRHYGYSGSAVANFPGAPLGEVFDACGRHGQPAALGAFIALPPVLRSQWRDDLAALALDQLVRLFGPEAAAPIQLDIQDWSLDTLTATANDAEPLLEHPHYGHRWFDLDHWHDKLYFSGSETARSGGGYMEGALQSAERVLKSLAISSRGKTSCA